MDYLFKNRFARAYRTWRLDQVRFCRKDLGNSASSGISSIPSARQHRQPDTGGADDFRVAIINATAVAITMHLIFRIGRQLKFHPILALSIALLTSCGRVVWQQATITDVYGLHILLVTAPIWMLLRWWETSDDRWIFGSIWVFFLGIANHPTTLFALPGYLIFVLVCKPRVLAMGKTWLHVLGALILTILLYAYIFIRSAQHPLFNEGLWDGPIDGNLTRFWMYLTARDFASTFGLSRDDLLSVARLFLVDGIQVIGILGMPAVLFGALGLVLRDWRRFLLLALVPLGLASASFIYKTGEPESWLAPVYPIIALSAGYLFFMVTGLFGDEFETPIRARRKRPVFRSHPHG